MRAPTRGLRGAIAIAARAANDRGKRANGSDGHKRAISVRAAVAKTAAKVRASMSAGMNPPAARAAANDSASKRVSAPNSPRYRASASPASSKRIRSMHIRARAAITSAFASDSPNPASNCSAMSPRAIVRARSA